MKEEKSLLELVFKDKTMRSITVEGEPWFVAKDVCDILEVSNPGQALSLLEKDEKNTIRLNDGKRGNPNKSIVNESGLYALIMNSRKKEAKEFRRWVTRVVLPTIRETGGYVVPNANTSDEKIKEKSLQNSERSIEASDSMERQLDNPLYGVILESLSENTKEIKLRNLMEYSPELLNSRLKKLIKDYEIKFNKTQKEAWTEFYKAFTNWSGHFIPNTSVSKIKYLEEHKMLPQALLIAEEMLNVTTDLSVVKEGCLNENIRN